MAFQNLTSSVLDLLRELISIPSFSRNEEKTAEQLLFFLKSRGISTQRRGNNVWAFSNLPQERKPMLLLNSHHDTVKPNPAWKRDPFQPALEKGKLYGLGSNDAGGALVSLLATFLYFHDRDDLPFHLLFAATAEEEISGPSGIASCLEEWPEIWAGIIGEPTSLDLAVSERGLIVIDGLTEGKAGHAARDEGENALYRAMEDIQRLKEFTFPKISNTLGSVKVTVTQIKAGTQHNVVPAECSFVVDVRTQDQYPNAAIVELLQAEMKWSQLTARSLRLNSSGIPMDHPLVRAGLNLGLRPYGSPTLSDQALLPFPTIKLGPGDSARSHTADEYIELKELEMGVQTYIQLLEQLKNLMIG